MERRYFGSTHIHTSQMPSKSQRQQLIEELEQALVLRELIEDSVATSDSDEDSDEMLWDTYVLVQCQRRVVV